MHASIHRDVILKILMAWLALGGALVSGQEPPSGPLGFIRLVNAVSAGTGKLQCLVDGKPVRPAGYQPGNVTGGIAMPPNSYRIGFQRDGVRAGGIQVTVAANDTTILIPFAEWVPATGERPGYWMIRVLKLKQYEQEDHRTATFVSVARAEELKVEIRQADRKWHPILVKRLGQTRAEIQQARGYLPVRVRGQALSSMAVATTGNFVSVLYENEQGVLQSRTFQDYKYHSSD